MRVTNLWLCSAVVIFASTFSPVTGASYSFPGAKSPWQGHHVATISVRDSYRLEFDVVFHSLSSTAYSSVFHVGQPKAMQTPQRLPAVYWTADGRLDLSTSTSYIVYDSGKTTVLEVGHKYHVFVQFLNGEYKAFCDDSLVFSRTRVLQSAENVPIWFSNWGSAVANCTVFNLSYVTPVPSNTTDDSKSANVVMLAALIVWGVVVLFAVICAFSLCVKYINSHKQKQSEDERDEKVKIALVPKVQLQGSAIGSPVHGPKWVVAAHGSDSEEDETKGWVDDAGDDAVADRELSEEMMYLDTTWKTLCTEHTQTEKRVANAKHISSRPTPKLTV